MGLSVDIELLVRKAHANTVVTVPEAGYPIPAPIYFTDVADFWATVDATKDTKSEIERTTIAATWIYPLIVSDDLSVGSPHSPLYRLTHEIYIFRGYRLTRADETVTPDDFGKTTLKAHNDFVAAWLGIKEAFQGKRAIAGLDDDIFAVKRSTPTTQGEYIQNRGNCEFIPMLQGFMVKLQETVEIQLREC